MESVIGTVGRRTQSSPAREAQIGAQRGIQSTTLDLFPNGKFSEAGALIVLNQTEEKRFETTALFATGDNRLLVIGTAINHELMDKQKLHEQIGQTRKQFGSWALRVLDARLPARLTRSTLKASFIQAAPLAAFYDLVRLYQAGKGEAVEIPAGLQVLSVMQDVTVTTWNTPQQSATPVSINEAEAAICVPSEEGIVREIADNLQTTAVIENNGFEGPFATSDSWGGFVTVISADRSTYVQTDPNDPSIGTFSTVSYGDVTYC